MIGRPRSWIRTPGPLSFCHPGKPGGRSDTSIWIKAAVWKSDTEGWWLLDCGGSVGATTTHGGPKVTFAISEGLPLRLMPFREYAAVGVMSWGTLLTLVPDPAGEENTGTRSDRGLREHAELRSAVHRLLKGAKGRNVQPYAEYIAAGLRGDLTAWSSPPICLWSYRALELSDGGATLPLGVPLVPVDGATQVAAMHTIKANPETFGLDEETIRLTPVAFEIYWNIATRDARQIFHDRHTLGVAAARTLALPMDQRDLATTVAQRVLTAEVPVNGRTESLGRFVNQSKRQLGQNDPEWMTLSALRSLCVTVLLGKRGIEAVSGTVEPSDLPGVDPETAMDETAAIVSGLVREFSAQLAARSALTAPAVLAAVGVVAHQTTSWAGDPRLTAEQLHSLLREVRWEREEKYWEGVAAKRTAGGRLSFAGGVRDSGHRVHEALTDPDSELGRRVRGC